ncbi:MAG: phosphoserine aminotransferase, partial [Rhodospirillaceae bacterium]|nr:phosphoserine aminotransferase [Rhodospirillaceae bacterium]
WPMPKIFRLTKSGKLIEGIFRGETINTPSMLAVEDALDGLKWAEGLVGGSGGGGKALQDRTKANLAAIEAWVDRTDWVGFLATDAAQRSRTSVCLMVTDDWFAGLDADAQGKAAKRLAKLLDEESAAYDIGGYRDAPPGLRLWAGSTVETADLVALFPWLDWAFAAVKAEMTS